MGTEAVIVLSLIVLALPLVVYILVGLLLQFLCAGVVNKHSPALPCLGFCLGIYVSLQSGFAVHQLNSYFIWRQGQSEMNTLLLFGQLTSGLVSVVLLSACSVMLVNLVCEVGLNWVLRALGRQESAINTSAFRPFLIILTVSLGFNLLSEFILENSGILKLLGA